MRSFHTVVIFQYMVSILISTSIYIYIMRAFVHKSKCIVNKAGLERVLVSQKTEKEK